MSPFNVVHYLSIVVILGPGLLLVLAAGELETGRRKAALLKLALVPVALLLVVGMFAVIWPGRATTASAADSRALYTAIAEGRLDDVKRLATGPHSVSTRQADIPPPLMYALVKQQERIANYLVAAGADVNAGVDGITPLHLAITWRYIDLVKVMIVKGASINARAAGERGGGGSPFLLAVSLGTYNEDEILTLFPPSGPGRMWLSSMPTGALPWSGTVETTRGLLRRNARSDVTDQNGLTPLMQALLFFKQSPTTDYLETARVLIDGAANVNAKSRGGHTPLMFAAAVNGDELVEVMVQHGADVNAENEAGQTALMAAAAHGYTPVVDLLLARGAKINVRAKDGKTALGLARDSGHAATERLLRTKGATD